MTGFLSTALVPFYWVRSAADYLSRISAQEPVVPVTTTMPPDLLAQVIDHLGYVLADDPTWPRGLRLVALKTLSTAAALKMPVSTEAEFHDAMVSEASAKTLDGGEQMVRRPRTGHSRGVQATLIPDRPGGQGLNTAARPVGT